MTRICMGFSLWLIPLTGVWAQATDTLSIFVNGLCGMCEDRIEAAARNTRGVLTADWNWQTRQLRVQTEVGKFREKQLHQGIAAVGHDTKVTKAPDPVYNDLPACCKYRGAERDSGARMHPQGNGSTVPEAASKDPLLGDENYIQGMVYERNAQKERIPLQGVNVRWLHSNVGTTTGADGHFALERFAGTKKIVVSYVGYQTDTIDMSGEQMVAIVLNNQLYLDEVEVSHRRRATEVSFVDPIKKMQIGEKELLKAACCNLSESFETTPSVDVVFTDAVTGTREIQMLGLAGPYVQVTREMIPEIRGLAALSGFTYTPGTWVEGIQLNKGTGSVVNGFEGITGQINVELKKPESSERLYANAYANQGGRIEGNLNISHQLNDRWSTGLLLHADAQQMEHDRNDDGFLDMPLLSTLIGMNRWKYQGENGWSSQFGLKVTSRRNEGGQLSDLKDELPQLWRSRIDVDRVEGFAKIGKVFPDRPYSSIGLQLAGVRHNQDARFGSRVFDAGQTSLYANLIYQSIIGSTNHQFRTGLSFQFDGVTETVGDRDYDRDERVPGAFFEYTWSGSKQFTAVAGIRGDYHNLFGFFVTPRLHLRYAPVDNTVLRASVGRGQRTANIFAENIGALASARAITVFGEDAANPYGLDPEIAWNYGVNLTQSLQLFGEIATFGFDYYFTNFENQIVVDYDFDPQQLLFYNLEGDSYSHSFQAQLDATPAPRFDIRVAYRFNDVQTDFREGQLQKPLVARHRAFINGAYSTKSDWAFDLTFNWQGAQRLPDTETNPEAFQARTESPDYVLMNAQVSKTWNKKFEVYLGGENLLDFRQGDPILGSSDPFGPYFDSSLVWGPVFGRNVYAGLRYRLW